MIHCIHRSASGSGTPSAGCVTVTIAVGPPTPTDPICARVATIATPAMRCVWAPWCSASGCPMPSKRTKLPVVGVPACVRQNGLRLTAAHRFWWRCGHFPGDVHASAVHARKGAVLRVQCVRTAAGVPLWDRINRCSAMCDEAPRAPRARSAVSACRAVFAWMWWHGRDMRVHLMP
jgi:hypothetical protein